MPRVGELWSVHPEWFRHGWELGSSLRWDVRTCVSPAGALGIGIPLPNVLGIPLIKVDIQILAVSVGQALSSCLCWCRSPGLFPPCRRWSGEQKPSSASQGHCALLSTNLMSGFL